MGVVTKKGLGGRPKEDSRFGPKTGVEECRDEEGDGIGYKVHEVEIEVVCLV